jgi:hypothetical protein
MKRPVEMTADLATAMHDEAPRDPHAMCRATRYVGRKTRAATMDVGHRPTRAECHSVRRQAVRASATAVGGTAIHSVATRGEARTDLRATAVRRPMREDAMTQGAMTAGPTTAEGHRPMRAAPHSVRHQVARASGMGAADQFVATSGAALTDHQEMLRATAGDDQTKVGAMMGGADRPMRVVPALVRHWAARAIATFADGTGVGAMAIQVVATLGVDLTDLRATLRHGQMTHGATTAGGLRATPKAADAIGATSRVARTTAAVATPYPIPIGSAETTHSSTFRELKHENMDLDWREFALSNCPLPCGTFRR